MAVSLEAVKLTKPVDVNIIVGQAHFIKTVEDLHEALAGTSAQLRFGIAFCEASGPRLIRKSGNDAELVQLAVTAASTIGAGHVFVVMMANGFPINVMRSIKDVPEVCSIFAATANQIEILVANTDQGRGIVGVIDGQPPLGTETDEDKKNRYRLLREIGYKL